MAIAKERRAVATERRLEALEAQVGMAVSAKAVPMEVAPQDPSTPEVANEGGVIVDVEHGGPALHRNHPG